MTTFAVFGYSIERFGHLDRFEGQYGNSTDDFRDAKRTFYEACDEMPDVDWCIRDLTTGWEMEP